MKVKLTYFKPNGKYYSDGEYETSYQYYFEVIKEVRQMFANGINPGLVDFAVIRDGFDTLVVCDDETQSVPHFIHANTIEEHNLIEDRLQTNEDENRRQRRQEARLHERNMSRYNRE